MTRPLAVLFAAVAFSTPLAACSGSGAVTKTAQTPAPVASTESPGGGPTGAPVANDHTLRRSVVRGVVRGGLGLFLQNVTLDDQPVMKEGRFHGFRIVALRDPALWSGVDLRPGDVVVRVNGMPIEHPEEALEVFHSLETSSELRVFYERDGQPHELKFAIIEDEPQKRADASAP